MDNLITMVLNKPISLLSLFFLIFILNGCLPPRCHVPYCGVLIDHRHPKYGREIAIMPKELVGVSKKKGRKISQNRNLTGQEIKDNTTAFAESPYQFYRGLPWYLFTFRKKYVDESGMIGGKYRKIDEREVNKYRKYIAINREKSAKMVAKLKEQQKKEDERRGLIEDSRNSAKDSAQANLELKEKNKKKKGKSDRIVDPLIIKSDLDKEEEEQEQKKKVKKKEDEKEEEKEDK